MPDRLGDETLYRTQRFPVYYPFSAQFVDDGGVPSTLLGAVARLEVTLNNRPHLITGFRLQNVYTIPEGFDSGQELLDRLDGQQSIVTDLTQQNIVVRPMLQTLLTGDQGFVWHPFECPYPFRGGNNVNVEVRRITSYPTLFQETETSVTVFGAVVGWGYVASGDLPAAGPPSTGFPTGR